MQFATRSKDGGCISKQQALEGTTGLPVGRGEPSPPRSFLLSTKTKQERREAKQSKNESKQQTRKTRQKRTPRTKQTQGRFSLRWRGGVFLECTDGRNAIYLAGCVVPSFSLECGSPSPTQPSASLPTVGTTVTPPTPTVGRCSAKATQALKTTCLS